MTSLLNRMPLPRPRVLVAIVAALALLGVLAIRLDADGRGGGGWSYHIVGLFHLGRENSVPAWFSAMLLLTNGFLMACVAGMDAGHGKRHRQLWRLAAALFVLLSLDETASLHERVGALISSRAGGLHGMWRFAWVIPGLALVGLLSACYLRFVLDLPPRRQVQLLGATGVYLGGAIGCEMAGGALEDAAGGAHTIAYWSTQVLEETLEMSGQIAWMTTLHLLLRDHEAAAADAVATAA